MNHRWMVLWGATLGATGVAAGAFGAHGLKNILLPSSLNVWEIGVRYQLIHAMMLLILFALAQLLDSRLIPRAAQLMAAGTLCFSGSLYLLACTGSKWLGPVTPFGGLLLIAGWLTLLYVGLKIRKMA
ncbi:protein of unknown function DUF423 [Tolumonas auensis DSM 9187]|uniref:DUF423 domain-containing protein n=1 Tax=Tolumonas auensis (strain DSM 9187 / NBRC 110442 / TA 4) TaxID=595494 RepID=C4LCG8_TOLAT|nr:DUF423 domain-containing protein [Tolumonas auensis]ACQ94472.1 protein of unknown function DUF423 [Tolumonas auensis DSM 9187]